MTTSQPTLTPRKKLAQPRFKDEVAVNRSLKKQYLNNDLDYDYESDSESDEEFCLLIETQDESNQLNSR